MGKTPESASSDKVRAPKPQPNRNTKLRFYRFGNWLWSVSGLSGKTIWDFLDLVIVPIALLCVAGIFTQAQHSTDLLIAEQNRQDAVLQEYLDDMGNLLLDQGLAVRLPSTLVLTDPGYAARELARQRTLTVLRTLDGSHRGVVISFLSETAPLNQSPHR